MIIFYNIMCIFVEICESVLKNIKLHDGSVNPDCIKYKTIKLKKNTL